MIRVVAFVAATCLVLAAAPVSAEEGPEEFVPPGYLEEGWYARIETDKGRILARLHPEQAPQAVAHFAGLAEGTLAWFDPLTGEERKEHYYDGVHVRKAVAAERFEAGDRSGTGRSTPSIFIPREGMRPIDFTQAGRLGMTLSAGSRISGVQFFVTAASQPWFNGQHPCFGTVVAGKDVVFNISQVKTYSNGRPVEPVVIDSVRIFSVGDPSPLPEPKPYKPVTPRLELNDRFKKPPK